MKILFMYALARPSEGYGFTHNAVYEGLIGGVYILPLLTIQHTLLSLGTTAETFSAKLFSGLTDNQVRDIGRAVLDAQGKDGFDLVETVSIEIDAIEAAKRQREQELDGIDDWAEQRGELSWS